MFGPRGVQEAPKRLQVQPKRRPRGSKLSPRCLEEFQVEPKKASEKARRATKGQSDNTSTAQKAKTLIFDDPTTLFKGLERSGRAAGGQAGAHFGCVEAKLELRRPSWTKSARTVKLVTTLQVQLASKAFGEWQVALGEWQVALGGFSSGSPIRNLLPKF